MKSKIHVSVGTGLICVYFAWAGMARAGVAPPPSASSAAAPTAQSAEVPAAEAPVFNKNEYRLGAGDKVRIIVFGEKDLTDEFVISPGGGIAFPLIGEINALGKTVGELRETLVGKLKTGYLRDPRVSIEVLTFRPFYILGEVNKPGEYPYTADLTVIKAVATAQGFTYRANTRRVLIKHAGEADEKAYPADASTPLAPGDIIRVRERFF